MAYGAEFFRWFSEEAVRVYGRTAHLPRANGRILVVKQPVGPVLAVTPELPAGHGHRKIGPAFAARCTVVVKPAGGHPADDAATGPVLADAGLPDGVLSVIPTLNSPDVVAALMADPRLRKVSFTGSTQVGKILIEQSAGRCCVRRWNSAATPVHRVRRRRHRRRRRGAFAAKMRTAVRHVPPPTGFWCTNAVREEFTAKPPRSSGGHQGFGDAEGVNLGPLINAKQRDRRQVVDEAVGPGSRPDRRQAVPGDGFFFEPTVLTTSRREPGFWARRSSVPSR